jgi:hypothetical protein
MKDYSSDVPDHAAPTMGVDAPLARIEMGTMRRRRRMPDP